MDDDSQVKVISRLTIDTSLALKNVRELAKEMGVTTKDVKRLAKEIEQSWKELDKARTSEATKAKQEERMWAQLAKQKEAERKAEEARMRQEIRLFEQAEAVRRRSEEQQARAAERAAAAQRKREEAAEKAAQAEQKRIADEIAKAWKEKERQDAAIARQMEQMHKQRAAEEAAREKERLAHGRAVEAQLAKEAAAKERLAKYEQDLQARIALRATKEREAAATALPSLSAQVSALQARMKLEGVVNFELKQQAAALRANIDLLQKQVAISGKMTDEQAQQVRNLQAQARALNASISQAAADQYSSVGGSLANMMGRRMEWFLAGTMFYGFQDAVRRSINDVADIEKRMVQLARVMEDPVFQADKMRESIFMLAQEFGFTFQEVQDIVLRWAQAGYDVQESLEATRASLLALNTAELNSEQATQSLIGIMAQWGFQADQLVTVIDKINKVADDYAVTSQDIVDGLLRSSGAARAANLTFEQTVALVTAMREASGRTGKEVGNALNSIIAYIQRAKSLETLESAGIPVFADAETKKLRSTFDLLTELAAKWNEIGGDAQQRFMEEAEAAGLFAEEVAEASGALEEWTDLQRRDISAAAAGTYRRNYLLALLNNFAKVQEVLITQEQSLGYSQRENQKTMDTAVKQWASFKAELQQLGYTVAAESGPLSMLKALVQVLRQGVDAFNRLPTPMKQVLSVLGLIGTTFGLVNLASRQFFGATIREVIKQARLDLTKLVDSLGGVRGALTRLGPLVLILSGIAFAIYKVNEQATRLQRTFEQTQKKVNETIRQYEAETKLHAQNAKAVEDLSNEYRALAKQKEEALATGDNSKAAEYAARQEEISQRIEAALGRETAARLKAAGFAKSAAETVAKAEREKVNQLSEAIQHEIDNYEKSLVAQMEVAVNSIKQLETQTGSWESYMTFMERMQVWWFRIIAVIKKGWYSLLADLAGLWSDFKGLVAKGLDLVGLDDWAEKMRKSAAESFAASYNYQAEADFGVEKWFNEQVANIINKDGGAIERQRKLLANLREELVRLQQETKGLDGPSTAPPGEFGTQATGASDIVSGIVAQTEALGKLNAETERQIRLLESRIAYHTREGATIDELRRADQDRADLLGLLATRQEQLHAQAESARATYKELAATQGTINTSTEEGARAYEEVGRAMDRMLTIAGDASAEWWQIERQKADILRENNAVSVETIRRLEELRDAYDDGLMSLDAYLQKLAELESQADLSKEAVKRLNEEQARGLREQWSNAVDAAFSDELAEIDAELQQVNDDLKAHVDLLDEVFAGYERVSRQMARDALRGNLSGALDAFLGVRQQFAPVDGNDLTKLALDALRGFNLSDLGALSPEEFAAAIGQDLDILRNASVTAQGYLDQVNGYAQQRLGEIQAELQDIDDWLTERLAELQAELDALDDEERQDERTKAEEEHTKRLQALLDERAWLVLQGEEDNAFRIAAIDKQLAEERAKWSEQTTKWARDDQREQIRDEMDAVRQRAEEQKRALEEERARIQEQQQLMADLLQAVLEFVNGEVEARREAAEDFKQQLQGEAEAKQTDLENTRAWLEEKRKALGEAWVNILADMAAHDPDFLARGQSLVNRIIEGINSRKSALEDAIEDLEDIMAGHGSGGSVYVPPAPPVPSPPTAAPPPSRFRPMAEGAYVKAGRGGVLGWIGEGKHDEWVLPEPKLMGMIQNAMRSVTATPATLGMGDIAGVIGRHVRAALEGMTIHGAVDLRMPDGTIQRVMVEMLRPLGPMVRGG